MSLPLLLGINGATAVLMVFAFLLELKDFMLLCGLRILYDHIVRGFTIPDRLFAMEANLRVLKKNTAFHPTAAKWRIKAIRGLVFKCLVEVKCFMVRSCIINQWRSWFCGAKMIRKYIPSNGQHKIVPSKKISLDAS